MGSYCKLSTTVFGIATIFLEPEGGIRPAEDIRASRIAIQLNEGMTACLFGMTGSAPDMDIIADAVRTGFVKCPEATAR